MAGPFSIGDLINLARTIKSEVGKVTDNQKDIKFQVEELYAGLQRLVNCEEHFRKLSRDADEFRHAIDVLHSDLLRSLKRLEVMQNGKGIRVKFKAFKDRNEITDEIRKLQQRVDGYYKRFSVSALAAVAGDVNDLKGAVGACQTMLVTITSNLSSSISEASSDITKATQLARVNTPDESALQSSLIQAKKELKDSKATQSFSSEAHAYLKLKIKVLTERLEHTSGGCPYISPQSNKPSDTTILIHASINGTGPGEDSEDTVLRCLRLLRLLTKNKQYTVGTSAESFVQDLESLSVSLCQIDFASDAVEIMEYALIFHRKFVKHSSRAYKVQLASLLNNRSTALLQANWSVKVAQQDIQDAVDIYRGLVVNDPSKFKPHLATALNNLSNVFALQDMHKESLDAILECVSIRRHIQTAHHLPEEFNFSLARSLHNLAECLTNVGSNDDALSISTQAAENLRPLADEQFSIFAPALATCLATRGRVLSALGRSEKALEVAKEVVQVHRKLVEKAGSQYKPNLADSLSTLSQAHRKLRHDRPALSTIEQAIRVGRTLVRNADPDHTVVFEKNLAADLHILSLCLIAVDRKDEAGKSMEEAINMRTELVHHEPDDMSCQRDLAQSLHNYAVLLFNQKQYQRAREVIDKAVKIRRSLAHADRIHQATLKQSLAVRDSVVSGLQWKANTKSSPDAKAPR